MVDNSGYKKEPRWGESAKQHAWAVTELGPGRGSATEWERRAASYVRERLEEMGLPDVRSQSFQGLRSIWLFLGLAFGFALAGHASFWILRSPVGDLAAAGVSIPFFAFSGLLMWRKFTFRDYPLREALPHGESQNVVAVIPPEGPVERQVVFIAHLDSHRAVWLFASDFLLSLYALLSPVSVYGLLIAPAIYILAALAGIPSLAWVGLALAIPHFVAWFTGMTADLGPYSPGANDNASAVGACLALAERLKEERLESSQVWLVFTGCEETGCDGMISFLEQYGPQLSQALFIDFEGVGIGERLVYLQREGVVRKRRISPQVERLVQEVGEDFDLEPTWLGTTGAFTEMGTLWEYGYRGVCFLALRRDKPMPPEWHRLTDYPDRLQASTLENVHQLAWSLLKKMDQGA